MEKTWRDAIVKVLSEADSPLHYTEVSEQTFARGYYQTDGATPAATVNAKISASIKHDGDKSPFVRVGKGIFSLKQTSSPLPKAQTPRDKITIAFESDANDYLM